MALNFFTQRDIENMDANDVSEEFINYFDGLSDERKAEIISSRPDLAVVLNYSVVKSVEVEISSLEEEEEFDDEYFEEENEELIELNQEQSYDFDEISENYYQGINLVDFADSSLNPFEALIIKDSQSRCIVHGTVFEEIQLKYSKGKGTLGIRPKYCPECNRLYVLESRIPSEETLNKIGVATKIYSKELTEAYCKSIIPESEFDTTEKIYIPDIWVEENPVCPVHNCSLDASPLFIKRDNRIVHFVGYRCNSCKKILMRRTKALDLEDECAIHGIIMPEYEALVENKPKKKSVTKKEIKPDFFIQDGKILEFTYSNSSEFYRLTEEDTIVVSDSIYCNLIGHDTEEVMIVFYVSQKKGGRKVYLCLAGYCSQCQKYYMDEEEYKVIYSLGRPEVTIISDLEDTDYQITSGEVFDIEKTHLATLEKEFDNKLNSIFNSSDYVSKYAVISGGYDDGGLSASKSRSENKYGDTIEKIGNYKPKPYTYRVDIIFDGKSEVYYIGADDIVLDGTKRVISYNSDFGKKLVNYRTINVVKEGKKYDIKLSRQFDIDNEQLFGYVNLRTDEDMIFRAGVTDPFLVKVLNLRKKQHNLVDIIATIQENQNAIVDEKMSKNIIVQGCAGSGKTMVLLHRLSSIKYNHPEYNFEQALILTPNDQFSLHIKGLADGMQIGNIARKSVEQYYIDLLCEYSKNFKPQNKLASEVYVKQIFVDYIYSDTFIKMFDEAYDEYIVSSHEMLPMLQGLCESFGEEYTEPVISSDSEYIPYIKSRVNRYLGMVHSQKEKISKAEATYIELNNRLKMIEEKIPKSEEYAEKVVRESLPRVNSKIAKFIQAMNEEINFLEQAVSYFENEYKKVENQIILFGKQAKLEDLSTKIENNRKKINAAKKKLEKAMPSFDFNSEGQTDEQIIFWMKLVKEYVGDVADEIRLCERCKKEPIELKIEQAQIKEQIGIVKKEREEAKAAEASKEVEQVITYLKSKVDEYSEINVFADIFEKATSLFKFENKVKGTKGTHRYDLYAELLFCVKFYNKTLGKEHFICVDEGQDMSINEYRLINKINGENVIFNIYGDVNQLLKPGRGISSWKTLKEEFQMEEYTLNENYRNTNQITRFCNASFDMKVLQTGVDGAKVRDIPRKELEKELSNLTVGNQRVAILIPRSVMKKKYLNLEVLPKNIKEVIGDEIDNGRISYMYVDEVKGIEFDKVFVVPNRMTKNEKYIAYTRALSELIVVDDISLNTDIINKKKVSGLQKNVIQKEKKSISYKNDIRFEESTGRKEKPQVLEKQAGDYNNTEHKSTNMAVKKFEEKVSKKVDETKSRNKKKKIDKQSSASGSSFAEIFAKLDIKNW